MEEDFEFGSPEEQKISVDRYEEMLRNQDQYFFDAKAFESIIEYYIDKNDPAKALQVAEYATAQHPYESIFLSRKAFLLMRTQQYAEALDTANKACILEPNSVEICLLKGGIYLHMCEIDTAEELFLKAVELEPDSAEAYFQLGELYQLTGNYEQACVYLKKSLEFNIENEEALHALAFCFDSLGKPEESISFYNEYINNRS